MWRGPTAFLLRSYTSQGEFRSPPPCLNPKSGHIEEGAGRGARSVAGFVPRAKPWHEIRDVQFGYRVWVQLLESERGLGVEDLGFRVCSQDPKFIRLRARGLRALGHQGFLKPGHPKALKPGNPKP